MYRYNRVKLIVFKALTYMKILKQLKLFFINMLTFHNLEVEVLGRQKPEHSR